MLLYITDESTISTVPPSGLLGGLLSVLMAGIATEASYRQKSRYSLLCPSCDPSLAVSLVEIFPELDRGGTAAGQVFLSLASFTAAGQVFLFQTKISIHSEENDWGLILLRINTEYCSPVN